MKLMWLGYLVYSLGNCAMKLCIETGLRSSQLGSRDMQILDVSTRLGGEQLPRYRH